jgi:hypothetical protein
MGEKKCGDAAVIPDAFKDNQSKASSFSVPQRQIQLATDVEKTAEIAQENMHQGPSGDVLVSRQSNIVDWDGANDLQNPQNWSTKKKWSIVILASTVTFNQCAISKF